MRVLRLKTPQRLTPQKSPILCATHTAFEVSQLQQAGAHELGSSGVQDSFQQNPLESPEYKIALARTRQAVSVQKAIQLKKSGSQARCACCTLCIRLQGRRLPGGRHACSVTLAGWLRNGKATRRPDSPALAACGWCAACLWDQG